MGTGRKIVLMIAAIALMAVAMPLLGELAGSFRGSNEIRAWSEQGKWAKALAEDGKIDETIALALSFEPVRPKILRRSPNGTGEISALYPSMLDSVMHILVRTRGTAALAAHIAGMEASGAVSRKDLDTVRRHAAPAIARTGEIAIATAMALAIGAPERRDSALLDSGETIARLDIDAMLRVTDLAGDPQRRVETLKAVAHSYYVTDDKKAWDRTVRHALQTASAIDDPVLRDESLMIVADQYTYLSKFGNALEIAPLLSSVRDRKVLLARVAQSQANTGSREDGLKTAAIIGGMEGEVARLKILSPRKIADGRIDEVMEEIAAISDGDSRDGLLLHLLPDAGEMRGLRGDPDIVMRLLGSVSESGKRDKAIFCQATLQAAARHLTSAWVVMDLASEEVFGFGHTVKIWTSFLSGRDRCER